MLAKPLLAIRYNFNGGASHEVITFSNAASIDAGDVLFV
jgi:hypothetical protein